MNEPAIMYAHNAMYSINGKSPSFVAIDGSECLFDDDADYKISENACI